MQIIIVIMGLVFDGLVVPVYNRLKRGRTGWVERVKLGGLCDKYGNK